MVTDKVRSLFWSKTRIRRNGCIEWLAFKDKTGYGHFGFKGGMVRTHRVSWILTNGKIPNGLCVLHKCDNPSCVNPEHLFLGTQLDNIKDRNTKGRTQKKLGFKHSKETIAKMSKPKSEEFKLKVSQTLKGKVKTEETKRKMSISAKKRCGVL